LGSKWINKDLFGAFQEQKKQEKEAPATGGIRRLDMLWKNPEKGTDTTPKIYVGRFVPDKNGKFYKKYFYHMFKSGEKWAFFLCPKTHDFDKFCPFCSATQKLYMGTAADKKIAYSYKRKEKYVGNFFIQDDPRDSERSEEDKCNKTVKLYEFPSKVEMKLKEQITDTKYGLGPAIFDPGDGGYDFIIKVLSTKKDPNGNIWPDYSNSEFARRPSAIAETDAEVDEIMKTVFDLDDYIASMERDDEAVEATLKAEMLWDLVKDEWSRIKKVTPPSKAELAAAAEEDDDIPEDEIYGNTTDEDDDDDSDAALLKELENL
jgi:hypothetical protein